jgi:hypothetical protein
MTHSLAPDSRTKWARYNAVPSVSCLAALALGPLTVHRPTTRGGTYYSFRNRRFNASTVRLLIDAGLAERIGDKVVARG